MVIPWIAEMAGMMSSSRDGGGEEDDDKVAKDLECFKNQPNINMTIPWIYQIYKSVKSGGGSGGASDMEWEDLTGRGDN